MCVNMAVQMVLVSERLVTYYTSKPLLFSMGTGVHGKFSMDTEVSGKIIPPVETLTTFCIFKWFLSGMDANMVDKRTFFSKLLMANCTLKWPLSAMDAVMGS